MQITHRILSNLCRVLSALLFWFSGVAGHGQVRGSVETFENEENTLSWYVYDFSDNMTYPPGWDLFEAGDPDLFSIVLPDSGASIFADSSSSGGDLVGDFSGNRIVGMGCDAFVEDASSLDYAELYFVSEGVFYYSIEFSTPQYFGSDGWDFMEVDFKEDPWYLLVDGRFAEVELTDEILASITEVGVDFFANGSRTESMLVAIDDFYLVPETVVPELTVGTSGGNFELSFMGEVSQEYRVLKSSGLSGWSELTGHSEITGDTTHTVSDPIGGKSFYQVETDFFFTIIPDVDSP